MSVVRCTLQVMVIVGIDPGYERLGLAVIEKTARGERLLHSECFRTKAEGSFPDRLREVGARLEVLMKEWKPNRVALETLFFSNNQKTAMTVSAVRGVILYEAARAKLPTFEYAPQEIKVAVGGHGRSDKKDVERMVRRLIRIEKKIEHDDEYDAIAAALTCAAREKL